jgi:hypothetical protein
LGGRPPWGELASARVNQRTDTSRALLFTPPPSPIPPPPPRQLLGQLLLESPDVRLMMRYVSDVRNLMLMMNLLKDNSRSIQFEAFHVFKVGRAPGGGPRRGAARGEGPTAAAR